MDIYLNIRNNIKDILFNSSLFTRKNLISASDVSKNRK